MSKYILSLVQELTCAKMHVQLSAKIEMSQNTWKRCKRCFYYFTF